MTTFNSQNNHLLKSSIFVIIGCFILAFHSIHCARRINDDLVRIGGIFSYEDKEEITALELAIERLNTAQSVRGVELRSLIKVINHTDILDTKEKVCELIRGGVAAIFGPMQSKPAILVQTIADKYEIPHLLLRNDFIFYKKRISVNLHPNGFTITKAIIDLVKNLQWQDFAVVYESNDDSIYVNEFLKAAREEVRYNDLKDGKLKVRPRNWNVRILQFKPNQPYSDTFWQMRQFGIFNFILYVRTSNLYRILKWAQQTGMITYKYSYVISSLDMHSIELEEFKYAKANIYYYKVTNEFNKDLLYKHHWQCSINHCAHRPYMSTYLKTSSSLIYDGMLVVASALRELKESSKHLTVANLDCASDLSWTQGSTFINQMRSVQLNGITSNIEFDTSTYRSKVEFNLMRLDDVGLVRIGHWTENLFTKEKPLQLQQPSSGPLFGSGPLKVITVFNAPYLMLKNSSKELFGNDRYEGYVVDLIHELSLVLKFEYEIYILASEKYGNCNQTEMDCDGMLGNVTRNEVDMAVVDLTITAERQSVVDFTLPFMNTGIGVLYFKVTKPQISLFSFLSPFSVGVWMILVLITLLISLTMHVYGRLSPYEWQNPYPCKQNENIRENGFNVRNCFWYIVGALLQQGSEFAPRSASTRWIAVVWYFVTLILVSSYTANLAAFLTVVNYEYPFNEAVELLQHPGIKFGCKENGSTCNFFQHSNDSNYLQMWERMEFVSSNEEGRARVVKENGKFAYFMESKAIEYDTERECKVTQRGGLLDNKGYGIAVNQHNKILKRQLDEGILKLQESGMLHILYDRWWKQKGGGTCDHISTGEGSALALENVGGVFVVLILGMKLAVILAFFELFLVVFKTASISHISYFDNIKRELRFAFNFQVPLKDNVRREEGKDEEDEQKA